MGSYKLQQGETLLDSFEGVSMDVEGSFFPQTGNLLLTDRRLVWVETGMFGKTKSQRSFPLSEVSVFQGRARAVIKYQKGGGSYDLSVSLSGDQLSFSFSQDDIRSAVEFANELNHAVTGTPADLYRAKKTGLIEDGVNMFKESLGMDPDLIEELTVYEPESVPASPSQQAAQPSLQRPAPPAVPQKVAGRCGYCRAPLKATAGRTVKCPYCGGEQEWPPASTAARE